MVIIMSGFKYPYTCDSIDREIGKSRGELISAMIDVFKNYGVKASFQDAQQAGEELFSTLSDVFENTRNINQSLRCEADKQLREKNDELIELRAKLFIAEKKLKEYESTDV